MAMFVSGSISSTGSFGKLRVIDDPATENRDGGIQVCSIGNFKSVGDGGVGAIGITNTNSNARALAIYTNQGSSQN